MNFSPTCRQKPECQCSTTIYCQRNSIFHEKKKLCIHYFTGQKQGLSGLKKYLASHHDRRPALRYFEPCINVQQKKQKTKTNKKMGKEKQPKQEVDKVKKVLVEEVCQCHF